MQCQHHVTVTIGKTSGNQAITLSDVDGDDTFLARVRVSIDRGLLDDTLLGTKNHEMVVDVIRIRDGREVDDGSNLVILLNLQDILDGATFGGLDTFRNLEHTEPEALTLFGKEEQVVVVGGHVEVFDEILIAGATALGALAATVLDLVFCQQRALDVTQVGDGDDHLFVGNGILHAELRSVKLNW